jgi:hypothetical protein
MARHLSRFPEFPSLARTPLGVHTFDFRKRARDFRITDGLDVLAMYAQAERPRTVCMGGVHAANPRHGPRVRFFPGALANGTALAARSSDRLDENQCCGFH